MKRQKHSFNYGDLVVAAGIAARLSGDSLGRAIYLALLVAAVYWLLELAVDWLRSR